MRDLWLVAAIVAIMSIATVMIADETAAQEQDTWIDESIVEICEEIGAQYGIQPELLEAIIETESSGQAGVVNATGCTGLMQISPGCHIERMARLGVTDLTDPYQNILVGADLLHELFEKYEDPYIVLGAYGGYSNIIAKVDTGFCPAYADKVLKRSRELEAVHGKLDTTQYTTDKQMLTWRANDE